MVCVPVQYVRIGGPELRLHGISIPQMCDRRGTTLTFDETVKLVGQLMLMLTEEGAEFCIFLGGIGIIVFIYIYPPVESAASAGVRVWGV